MRKININDVVEGMKLAKTIYSMDGRPLLNAKTELKSSYIKRLKRMGIPAIFVYTSSDDEDVDTGEAISETTKAEAIKVVSDSMNNIVRGRSVDARPVKEAVGKIIDDITSNNEILVGLSDIRSADTYTFSHSVNVCVLAILIGLNSNLNSLKLRNLGVGALLHDIGKTEIPPDILKKPSRLTRGEFNTIKDHPKYGFDMLRKIEGLNILSAHVAYQHHERLDGTGYPRNLFGDQIHEFGLIGGVADTYDALTADRVYKRAMHPSEAVKVLMRHSNLKLDKKSVDRLIKNITMYPVGTVVYLNSGEKCEVVGLEKGNPDSPVVKVILHENGTKPSKDIKIQLAKDKSRYITEASFD